METVAFYSYKGGVGRSLLLANAARFLATLGKGVVALDFDFEAPGLHYKLGNAASSEALPEGGAVPYLIATAEGATSPPPLEKHLVSLPVPSSSEGWLRLMPAGPAPRQAYWTAFKELGEKLHFGDPSGEGFMALLDLQARIDDELKPDYLLIDARTGVTELGGLATTILADTVVCMFVPNQESLDGTLAIVEALKAAPRLTKQGPIRVVPVLSRTTAKSSDDERFTSGIRRLLELGEGKNYQDKGKIALFALPHDSVIGSSDRVIGGERNASAFSPLYKAYLELFQRLFPTRAELAQHVLERLEAVAEIREDLTRSRGEGYRSDDLFAPWSPSAIQEGFLWKPNRVEGHRYADLVCRAETGPALMIVEYLADGGEAAALQFWKNTKVRCVVLLVKGQYRERRVFTRSLDQDDLRLVERRDLPRPREFELLRDVGDQSVESMLDAVRHGHVEAVAWLVDEWREASAASTTRGPQRPPWRPERAQRILDGLAATEDLQCAEEALRRATPGGYDYRPRRHRFRERWEWSGEDVEQRTAEEFFAPLFWRLPVEATLKSMEGRQHPGEIPSPAGYRLLAGDLMGLRWDPDRTALEDARALAFRLPAKENRGTDDDNERALVWLRRSQRERIERVKFTDEAPPALVWEEVLREELYWRGTLDEARAKVGKKLRELMTSSASLRTRLKAIASRRDLVAQGLFGSFESSGRIELFAPVIAAAADVLGMSSRYLTSIVFIHFSVWSLAYEARDLDGQRGHGFAPSARNSPLSRESPTHVALVQAFTDRLIRLLKDANLQAAFEKLSKHQPEPYNRWMSMRKLPLEELHMLLLAARGNASALGLPASNENE